MSSHGATISLLLLLLAMQGALGQIVSPTTAGSSPSASSGTKALVINEVLVDNKHALQDENGDTPPWVELYNGAAAPASLAGFVLSISRAASDSNASDAWAFPPGSVLQPGSFLVVFLDSRSPNETAPSAATSPSLHASFKLSSEDDYLALRSPMGALVSEVVLPWPAPDVSFGLAGNAGLVTAQDDSNTPQYAPLATPTPGKANSGPLAGKGPLVLGTLRSPTPRPDGSAAINVTTTVAQQQNPVASVQLVYVIGYGPETTVNMTPAANASSMSNSSSSNSSGVQGGTLYSAAIPAAVAVPGALVRWAVVATDSTGSTTRDPIMPASSSSSSSREDRKYFGTVVANSTDQASLPLIDLYCPDAHAPFSDGGVQGCSMWLGGEFYDGLRVGRRGVTSRSWPKPSFQVAAKGDVMRTVPGLPRVKTLDVNSGWQEPGENTFMREPLVWQAFKNMGLESLESSNVHVRLDGQFFGKFDTVESPAVTTLQRWGYAVEPSAGPLFKSTSGEFSNLRWDIPPDQVKYYWKLSASTIKGSNATAEAELIAFAKGLSGGGGEHRSRYLFDAVNLPQVINHMAAQTIVLNQDRCTKNFYVYLDPSTSQWSMFPWDVKAGFASDRGLGGQPAPDYCIESCDQWTSPLYCDHNHPQDLLVKTPWVLIQSVYPIDTSGRRRMQQSQRQQSVSNAALAQDARKLLQGDTLPALVDAADAVSGPAAEGTAGMLPANSSIEPSYDVDQTLLAPGSAPPAASVGSSALVTRVLPAPEYSDPDINLQSLGPTKTGAVGTYNYLIDAILSVPTTRAMYMRRLRTLMDQFIATGRLEALVGTMYQQIRDEAKRDAAKWGNSGDPDRGYQQLITEQLPIRKQQLYDFYGPNGSIPLIPDAQPASVSLGLGSIVPGASAGYVEVTNPNAFAVDISGYSVSGAVTFTFRPGTVIPPSSSIYIAASVKAFLQQHGGQGALVVGPFRGLLLGRAAALSLADAAGNLLVSS